MRRFLLAAIAASLIVGGLTFVSSAPAAAASCASGYTTTQGKLVVNYRAYDGVAGDGSIVRFTYLGSGCYNGSKSYSLGNPTITKLSNIDGIAKLISGPGSGWNSSGFTDYYANYDIGYNTADALGNPTWHHYAYGYPRLRLYPNGTWGEWNYESDSGNNFRVISVGHA